MFLALRHNRHVVAFDSAADLVPNDGNGTVDVYVHDLDTGVTEAASIGPAGSSFVTNHGSNANISATGRFVARVEEAAPGLEPDPLAAQAPGAA